ncbi:MAG: arginyltransferase, partial [Planctomycetia bacterium]
MAKRAQPPPDATPAAGATHPVVAWVERTTLMHLPAQPCAYLPGQSARERAFLAQRLDGAGYHALMDRGFRRSGSVFYRPDCAGCRRCVPLRVPVATFTPTRSQRRVARKNADIVLTVRRPQCTPATFELYQRYLAYQHPEPARERSYEAFEEGYYSEVVDSLEVLYTLEGRVVAVSLLDVCAQSVSAVYHFFDPGCAARSLGVYSVLAEIEWARQAGVPHYYLGYWVEGSATMAYKAQYGPHELLLDGRWVPGAPPGREPGPASVPAPPARPAGGSAPGAPLG